MRVAITAKAADINMYSAEVHRLVGFIVDYVYLDTILLACARYLRLARLKAAQARPRRLPLSGPELLTVAVDSIQIHLAGYSYANYEHLSQRFVFPKSPMTVSIPNFSLTYDYSKPGVPPERSCRASNSRSCAAACGWRTTMEPPCCSSRI